MSDKRVATLLCDVIGGAERRVANGPQRRGYGEYGSRDAFWKRFQQLRQFVRHAESTSE